METTNLTPSESKRDVYSVWALPPENLMPRLKKLMDGLRSDFGGPQFDPHATVVGAISLTEGEALDMFTKACGGLKAYSVSVDKVATGTFFYQCVFLLLHHTPEVVEASTHCCGHFGYKNSSPYMPHLSLLYGDLTEEEKKKAQEKAYVIDDSIGSLTFQISRLALYKTDTGDKSCESWEKNHRLIYSGGAESYQFSTSRCHQNIGEPWCDYWLPCMYKMPVRYRNVRLIPQNLILQSVRKRISIAE